jgi:hypothetical protein
MSKTMYQMNERELEEFIGRQEHLVDTLQHDRPGSPEYHFEAGVLQDARQLLDQKRRKPRSS